MSNSITLVRRAAEQEDNPYHYTPSLVMVGHECCSFLHRSVSDLRVFLLAGDHLPRHLRPLVGCAHLSNRQGSPLLHARDGSRGSQ